MTTTAKLTNLTEMEEIQALEDFFWDDKLHDEFVLSVDKEAPSGWEMMLRKGDIACFNKEVAALPSAYRACIWRRNLAGLDLRGIQLGGASLNGTDFIGCDLRGIDFTGTSPL